MTNEQAGFERDSLFLKASDDLAMSAVEMVGADDASAALIAAAMKLWGAQFGYDGAMGAARAALESIVANQDNHRRAN